MRVLLFQEIIFLQSDVSKATGLVTVPLLVVGIPFLNKVQIVVHVMNNNFKNFIE